MTIHAERPPIFILGMLQRTGTNHLWDMIGLHPDTELLRPVFEDHLLRWSSHLTAYVEDVSRCWSEEWDVPATERQALQRSLGDGVAAWVAAHSSRRVVTKMPSVEQLENYTSLFPRCPLVLLVRDGRSVCESGVKSFGWSYERAFWRWATAAESVVELTNSIERPDNMIVVRFEQLIDDPETVMREVCTVAGLDPDTYPYEQIDGLPVRGSSTLRTVAGSDMHWVPVERTDSFDPRERWRSWSDHTHRRFNAVAGDQQRALGYDICDIDGSATVAQRLADARDRLWDVRRRQVRVKLGRARRAVKRS